MKKTIVFFGSSDFSVPCLKLLHQHCNVLCLYTQPPHKKGRGMVMQKTPTHILADELSIPVKNPQKLTQNDEIYLMTLNPDFLIVVSYGLILPSFVLSTAKSSLNIHPSALPKYRGAAPIERAVEACENNTKLCIIKMTKRLDAGNIVYQSQDINIVGKDSLYLSSFFAQMGAEAMLNVIENGEVCNIAQDETVTTYAHKITKHDLELSQDLIKNSTTRQIIAKIMAFTTHGFAKFAIAGRICKIIDAFDVDILSIENIMTKIKCNQKQAAKIVKYAIQCKDGFVVPTNLIPQNAKQMKFVDFVNGLE